MKNTLINRIATEKIAQALGELNEKVVYVGGAPANPWFASGFQYGEIVDLNGIQIKILSLPYFLATKFSAFKSRGSKDPRTSHDFEDIVYLLNHTSNTRELILRAGKDARLFLKDAFLEILEDDRQQEAIIGNLYHEEQMERFEKIIGALKAIVQDI